MSSFSTKIYTTTLYSVIIGNQTLLKFVQEITNGKPKLPSLFNPRVSQAFLVDEKKCFILNGKKATKKVELKKKLNESLSSFSLTNHHKVYLFRRSLHLNLLTC